MSAPSCAHTPSPSHILQIDTPDGDDTMLESAAGQGPLLAAAAAGCCAGCIDCKWLRYLQAHCPTDQQLPNFNSPCQNEEGTAREQGSLGRASLLPYGRNVRGITWNSNAFF